MFLFAFMYFSQPSPARPPSPVQVNWWWGKKPHIFFNSYILTGIYENPPISTLLITLNWCMNSDDHYLLMQSNSIMAPAFHHKHLLYLPLPHKHHSFMKEKTNFEQCFCWYWFVQWIRKERTYTAFPACNTNSKPIKVPSETNNIN
jgi:hypothetical protein